MDVHSLAAYLQSSRKPASHLGGLWDDITTNVTETVVDTTSNFLQSQGVGGEVAAAALNAATGNTPQTQSQQQAIQASAGLNMNQLSALQAIASKKEYKDLHQSLQLLSKAASGTGTLRDRVARASAAARIRKAMKNPQFMELVKSEMEAQAKAASRKKWVIGGGIALGVVAIGTTAYILLMD